jgi:cytoskeletal protein RodZ
MSNQQSESLGLFVGFSLVFVLLAIAIIIIIRKQIRAKINRNKTKNMDASPMGSAAQNNEPSRPPSSEQPQTAPIQTAQTQAVIAPTNTSGQGHATIVPPEVRGWSWGAFLLSWIWGLGNETYLALLCFVPFVNFVMIFVLGAKGNEWAWRNKQWTNIEDFKRVQRKWAIAGVIVLGATVLAVVGILALTVFLALKYPVNPGPINPATYDTSASSSSDVQTAGSFDLLDDHYVLADNLSNDQQDYYEFILEGQDINSWQNLVTLVRDKTYAGAATNSDVDADAEATLKDLKSKGAFVYNSFTTTSTVDGPVDVMTIAFVETSTAEIDIKKIFLTHDGDVESATYGAMVSGSSSDDLKKNVDDYLGQTSDIGPQIIDFEFPEPWNLER